MTSPAQKPVWYHQIRWRLTFSYGFGLLLTFVIVELLMLALLVANAYIRNPQLDPVALYLARMRLVLFDAVRGIPIFFVIGHLFSRRFSSRLERLQRAAVAWGTGDFSPQLRDDSPDEIGILTRELVDMSSQLETLVETEQELAAARERDRIARDLHDTVKQQVFATQMELNAAQNLLHSDPDAAEEMLADAIDLTRESQRELKSLIDRLPPAGLEHRTLGTVLREYVDSVRNLGIDVRVHVEGDRDLPVEMEEAFYRVAQGALSNVEKHSKAPSITVKLEYSDNQVMMRISDNGIGFDAETPSINEFGLESMRTRMRQIGGTLSVTSQPGQGTVVTAVAPVGVDT